MGFGFFCSLLILSLFFKHFTCQLPNTDGFYVSNFLNKIGSNSSLSYNFPGSVCSWVRVKCDDTKENVITLKASGLGLSAQLQSLDVSNNKITALPSDFWSLVSLKSLNLSYNQISGSLPNNIGNFGLLEVMDLSGNNFSGEIPATISSLVSLKVLKLGGNGFEWSIPEGILSCQSLVSLDFSSNHLNGSLPDGFGAAFPKLKTLNLARNEIHGRVVDVAEMKSLTILNISRNLFKGSVVGVFQGQLEVIDLSKNQFQGHVSQVQFKWSHLIYLDLSENQLSGEIFMNLSQAQNLRHLNLACNRFASQKFLRIEMLLGLEYLNLSKTSLIGRIPLLANQNLKSLDVSHNNLSGEVPISLLEKLHFMERYNFSYNNLTLCDSGRPHTHKRFKLALALTLSVVCLLGGLLLLAFSCRKKSRTWIVKQPSYKEENISGPFSFQTDSTTWVADVTQAESVPVVIFEKPLLNLTFADLLIATSNFDRGTLLAEGKFGPVYRGFLPGGNHVAVKVLVHGSRLTNQEAARELESLGRIKHPNLVPLTGYCLAGDQRIAIYDYMENGNLQNLLYDLPLGVQATEDWSTDTWEEEDNNGVNNVGSKGLLQTWGFRYKIALGVARALAFLHHGCSPPLIHRDVKASSVYLDSNLEPRLSDFGLATVFATGAEDEIVPPEPKSDVYCFGVVLFELTTGKKPIGDDYPEEQAANLVSWVRGLVRKSQGSKAIDPKIRETGPGYLMEEALKIGYLCTADIPNKRPTMQQIVGLLKDIEPRATV
ncbi:hypothetical protein ES319_A07G031600v1 [Gossypium barbadense]|uniref:Protein kinase domain-containing protein n=1 Tax=Gossypium barbadense TaxID=3634 RepID=A0A5J5UZ34_GOSBA|nr:hypothetical protein ES319_A07G031600v1 [Gossypium barbadense]